MSKSTGMEISSIHKSILEWSEGRASWQRDALRRLVENSEFDDSDIEALLTMCQSEHDLLEDDEDSPSAAPLTRDHLPAVAAAGQSVGLRSVSDVKHVNALPNNQTLTFCETGLTIVYGDNGSGKTGYSRILKRACRARNQGDKIRPNVYEKAPCEPARARIEYNIGDIPGMAEWIDGHETPLELSAISFFDSDCAVVHVEETNDIAFTPFGLDLLESLAEVCGLVKTKLDGIKRQTESDKPASLRTPKCQPLTRVGKAIGSLTRNTDFEKLAALGTLDQTEQDRLQQIKQDLAADPMKLAAAVKGRRTRLESLLSAVSAITEALSESRVETLRNLAEECQAKKKAAEVASTSLFADEPLPNVGSDTWRSLWESARRYSNQEAYADTEFPFVDEGAKCVLCQQELQSDARRRLGNFEEFVKDEAAATAQDAEERFQRAQRRIEDAGLRTIAYKPVVEELAIDNNAVAASVRRAVVRLRLRRRAILRALETTTFDAVGNMPGFPSDGCKQAVNALRDREAGLSKSADPDKRKELKAELQELEDRKWLSTVLDDVENEIWRLGYNARPFARITVQPGRRVAELAHVDVNHPILVERKDLARFTEYDGWEPTDEDDGTYSGLLYMLNKVRRVSQVGPNEDVFLGEPVGEQPDALPQWGKRLGLPEFRDDSAVRDRNSPLDASDQEELWSDNMEINAILSRLVVGPGQLLRDRLSELRYLGPLRKIPERRHTPPQHPEPSRWASGLGAWDLLETGEDKFVDEVSQWLGDEDRLDAGYHLERRRFKELDLSNELVVKLLTGRAFDEVDDDARLALDGLATHSRNRSIVIDCGDGVLETRQASGRSSGQSGP